MVGLSNEFYVFIYPSDILSRRKSCRYCSMSNPEFLDTLRHSASHVMAAAVKRIYPDARLAIGPSIEDGFYYDFDIGEETFSPEDLKKITAEMNRIISTKESFERIEMPRAEAMEKMKETGEIYKVELLEDLAEDTVSFYRTGDFLDLCKGPHVENAGEIKAFALLRTAGAYWRGDSTRKMLQRIYGTAFESRKDLKKHLKKVEQAKQRDHRKIGKAMDLFSFHEEGPGFPFWHDRGVTLFNLLIEYMRKRLKEKNYKEVKTPIILNEDLWHRSGHWDNFKENMYFTEIDDANYAVKPMNCPGSLLLYKSDLHSYRELPLRVAEFGLVHRHELSGVLHGLLRVRSFTQDDAHSFCMPEQLEDEVKELVNFTVDTYKDFGFNEYTIFVATRPAKAMGSDELWDKATDALKNSLDALGLSCEIKEGEGAFYGPKIEFDVRDCLGRDWQLGTVQVDFSMPERFDLTYIGSDSSEHRPVMVHRAILGAIERFLGILLEHYGGNLPLWLAPVQVMVASISEDQNDYVREVYDLLSREGFRVESDTRNEKIGYKIREASQQKIPVILIAGDREKENRTVSIRMLGKGDAGSMSLEDAVQDLKTKTRIGGE